MAYETNRFCWHGLVTTDSAKAAAFYTEVMGWSVQEIPMGDAKAAMFAAGGVPMAHFVPPPMPGIPSHWDNYLRVDDVDATSKAAAANGGAVMVPGTDIPPGRFAVVTSPSGAAISLFREADETAQHHPGGTGGVHWVELHSKDIGADLAWLKSTFAFAVSDMPLPNGGTYRLLVHDGQQRGGAMAAMFGQAPSMWLTWFAVDDADGAVARVEAHGGQAHMGPMDMPGVGRMAVVADPMGAAFGVIAPAAQ